jgi:cellulose synthase operon protein C
VLRRPLGLGTLLVLAALCPARASADAAGTKAGKGAGADAEPPRAIQEPVRLTAGASSDLMGVLGADEKSLYFVSDASGTLDILLQAPVQSGPVTLSGGLGDAAWPQISRDGKHIAYISFENDSTGDVCVRDVSDEREAGPAKCLTNADSAELMVLWWNDSSLAVLTRPGLHGDFRLSRLPIDGGPPQLLVARNMVGVAVSPDRRWLAYIPVNKAAQDVGINFAQRAAVGVGLQRLGTDGEPALYVPRLPGVTGSVAFSPQGDHLEFTQFLNDTNRDGTIDGDDNAVLFRVPFRGGERSPLSPDDEPEQLTSARWDCHYPAPAKSQLIASCSHEGSLDVYSLPLDGAVPREWDDARLVGEAAVARDLWTRLLLAARRLVLASSPAAKEPVLLDMIALHLELGEYEAAIYHAENRLVSDEARRFGRIVAELARHRRADLALIRGETSAQYIDSERARAQALRAEIGQAPARLAQLALLVISEIEDDVGDKAAALATFERLELAKLEEPLTCALAARRAARLYRLRGDRERLLDTYRVLSTLPALDTARRLEYAERFVRELARGRTRSARLQALATAETQVDAQSELGLLLAVEKVLATLDDASQEAVRAQIFELYKQNKDTDRRRALVLSTLSAAAKAGNEYVQYQFVTSWVSSLSRKHPERKYAEALYRDIVLDRAYGEGRQGRVDESRGYFYGTTIATDSLEAHIGFIEARLAEGGPKVSETIDEVYEKRFARDPDSPVYAFVKAYRIARELPRELDAERHERSVSRAIELLTRALDELPKEPQLHQIWGFVLHQRARRDGSREAAVAANRQYLLALDLARDDERLTATLLHRLGLLQASLGNHGAALRHLRRRDQLPHVRPEEELGLRVAIARSAWHSGDNALAKQQMLAATELVEKTPELGRYSALVVDRLGLALAAAGDASAARERYAELDGLLARDKGATKINHVKAKVGFAASALSSGQAAKALEALDAADRFLDEGGDLEPKPDVVWRRSLIDNYRYSPVQYRALVAGLRAGADRALEDYPSALSATALRVELLEKRLRETGADEDRLELAQAYHHLAELHDRLGDANAAARAVEKGLTLSDQYDENTGGEVNDAGLALIRDYAELHLYRGVPLEALRRNLKTELLRVYSVICKYRNPRWATERYLFKTYLTELALNERL